jgi:hypothetical protein
MIKQALGGRNEAWQRLMEKQAFLFIDHHLMLYASRLMPNSETRREE